MRPDACQVEPMNLSRVHHVLIVTESNLKDRQEGKRERPIHESQTI